MAEVIDIVVRQRGARTVSRDISEIGRSAEQSAGALDFLSRALKVAIGGAALREAVKLADGYRNLQNRVSLFAKDQADANDVLKQLLRIADGAGASLDAVGETYSRISIATQRLGVSTGETLRVTELLTKGLAASGATAAESEGALRQIGQALAGDFKSSGQELNSILEQAPALAAAVATGLGTTSDKLKALAREGQLSADLFIRALLSQGAAIDELAKRASGGLFERSFQRLGNAATVFVGKLSETTGIGAAFTSALDSMAQGIESLASNGTALNAVLATLTIGLGALAGAALPALASGALAAARGLIALGAAALANPFTLITVAIGAIIAALFVFRKEIVALLRPFRSVINSLVQGFAILGQTVGLVLSKLVDGILSIPKALKLATHGEFKAAGAALAEGFGGGFKERFQQIVNDSLKIDTFGKLEKLVEAKPAQAAVEKPFGNLPTAPPIANLIPTEKAKKTKKGPIERFRELQGELDPFEALKQEKAKREALIAAAKEAGIDAKELVAAQAKVNRAFEEGKLEIVEYTNTLRGIEAVNAGVSVAFQDFARGAVSQFDLIRDSTSAVLDGMLDAVDRFVETGKLSFRDFASSVLKEISKIALESALLNAISGIGIPGLKIPGRAAGGPVSAGQPFLVGERGPELFVPPRTGRVIPNGDLAAAAAGAGGRSINVVMNIQTPDANSFQRSQSQILKAANRELARTERRR